MKFIRTIWLVLAVSLAGSTCLGAGVTGGGNVVVCDYNDGRRTVRLLDYYEAEVLMPAVKIDLGSGATPMEMVKTALARLQRVDPVRAKAYETGANDFFKNWLLVKGVILPDINDHGYIPIDNAHCRKEQVAVQNISPFPQSKKYTVREEYWNALSQQDRAGLILHEVIYGEALALGHKTSANSRYINALVSSPYFDTLSAADYEERLRRFGFDAKSNNHPPIWVGGPTLTVASGSVNQFQLSSYVQDPDGDTLSFSGRYVPPFSPDRPSIDFRSSGFIEVNATGVAPGDNFYEITATDGAESVTESVRIVVIPDPSKPAPVIELPDAIVGDAYSAEVGRYFTCSVGSLYSSHPLVPWVRVGFSATGQIVIQGTPALGDIGSGTVPIEFTCDHKEARVFQITVKPKSTHPFLTRLPDAFEGQLYQVNLATAVTACGTKACHFSAKELPKWLTLDPNTGIATGKPARTDVGDYEFDLLWQTGDSGGFGRVQVRVLHINQPPFFYKNPVILPMAKANNSYQYNLANDFSDPDLGPEILTVKKVSGPTWISVTSTGLLSGTPGRDDIGPFQISLEVCDAEGACAKAIALGDIVP